MRFTSVTQAIILTFTASALAAPADKIDYTPKGDWESVKYPEGTGENLEHYPTPKGGWENVEHPAGTGAGTGCPDSFKFTSTYHVIAKGDQVRNGTIPTPGPKDAIGHFDFYINGPADTICYSIMLENVAGTYQSPARPATHIHEAARGASGPPRLAFPNPVGNDKKRVFAGCMTGPFTTRLNGPNAQDTGTGFRVSQIEANPAQFFADSHTNLFSLGVVRGQLA